MKLSARSALRLRAAFSFSLSVIFASTAAKAQSPSSSLASTPFPTPLALTSATISEIPPQEWSMRWWRWSLSYPASRNPLLDPHGEYVQEGDQGPAFFLAGNFGGSTTREATVRSDQWILAPILTSAFWAPDQGRTEFELRSKAARFAESAQSLFLAIDGQDIAIAPAIDGAMEPEGGIWTWRRHVPLLPGSPLPPLSFAKGNPLGASEGVKPAVIDGYFALIPPLPPGLHEIRFGGRTPDFAQDSRYLIRSVAGPIAPAVKTIGFLGSSRRVNGLKIRFTQRIGSAATLDPKHWQIETYHNDGGLGQIIRVAAIQAEPDRQTFAARFTAPFALADLQAVRVTVRDSLSNAGGVFLDGDRDGEPGGEYHAVFKTFSASSVSYVESDGDRVRLSLSGGGHMEGLRLENGGLHQAWLVQPGRQSHLRASFTPASNSRSDGRASVLELIGASRVDARQVLNHPAFRVRSLTADHNAEGF